MRKQVVIIPALNPGESLWQYVKQLLMRGFPEIIVVNDGSLDELTYIFDELSKLDHCTVLTHKINKGKGQALKTAFHYFLEHFSYFDGVITADADGQHAVKDVCRLSDRFQERNTDLVLGVRQFSKDAVPIKSSIGNRVTSILFFLFFKKWLADTQTGLRAIAKEELENITKLRGSRYEFEMNMLVYAIKRNIRISEVPIETIYYENNSGSYFRAIKDSFIILRKLFSGAFYFNKRYKDILKDKTERLP